MEEVQRLFSNNKAVPSFSTGVQKQEGVCSVMERGHTGNTQENFKFGHQYGLFNRSDTRVGEYEEVKSKTNYILAKKRTIKKTKIAMEVVYSSINPALHWEEVIIIFLN